MTHLLLFVLDVSLLCFCNLEDQDTPSWKIRRSSKRKDIFCVQRAQYVSSNSMSFNKQKHPKQ
jgi:hypothetical protein